MSRLIVVSNRVAPIDEGKASTGGLAVAVLAALKKAGGVWFGWSGDVVGNPQPEPKMVQVGRLTYATIDLAERDYEEYYSGFANSTLWPLFHYRLDLTEFNRRTYAGYLRVNGLFAMRLAPLLAPDDLVWVHDYHLIPCGEQLRQMGLAQRMGFFLHTPFPVPEILVSLPNHDTLVRSLCAYDVVGFQTRRDLGAFVSYLVSEARAEVLGENLIRAFGRVIKVDAFPISVETAELEKQATITIRSRQAERLRESLVDRDLIIGVDRLDYSKGLPQRLEAFQVLLENYAENRGRVTFMQIAPPTRADVQEYIDIRRELESKAGHINGRFAEFDWVPIRYLNKSFSRRNLLAFYRTSRIGLVTPLRDGMNLVAKEYVAAQDPDNPGVLVLSRFAGAAAELDAALIVNPYDVEGVAENLQRGLTMPLEERQERQRALIEVLRDNNIDTWRHRFIDALTAAPYAP
ncbi:MAG: alpha,alpha-trehalose-phosphate synthase (UDP-forming) [Alphaproteobacteria bacterium]